MLCFQLPEILQKLEMSVVLLNSPVDYNVPTFKTHNQSEMQEIKDKHRDKMHQFCSHSKSLDQVCSFNLTFFDLPLKNSDEGLVSLQEKGKINLRIFLKLFSFHCPQNLESQTLSASLCSASSYNSHFHGYTSPCKWDWLFSLSILWSPSVPKWDFKALLCQVGQAGLHICWDWWKPAQWCSWCWEKAFSNLPKEKLQDASSDIAGLLLS